MSNEVTRRNFFQVAAGAAVAATALGTLSGCNAPEIVEEAVAHTDEVTTPAWLGAAPVIAEADITETIDVEVCVVGCRTGGLPAVIAAAEAGADVLGVEMLSDIAKPREDLGAINSKLQLASFDEFPQFEIDKMEAMEDIVRYANGFVKYDLIKKWADESGAMIDWITEIIERNGDMVMNFEGSIGTESEARDKAYATGHSPELLTDDENAHFGTVLRDYAEEQGANFRYSTMLVKCEQDEDGRVTGVICQDQTDDHYVRINASKGVIIATGGYSTNNEMMEARQAYNQRLRINVQGRGAASTGDGIKAAMWCGAAIDPLGASVTFNRACCLPTETAGSSEPGKWFWFGEQPFLKVNLNGERFCNESGPYDYCLHSAFMQPDHTYVDIWDSDWVAKVAQLNEVGCCRLYPFDNGAPSNMGTDLVAMFLEQLIEAGYVQQADTIEELAEKLNIPVETTVASWERYNKWCAQGKDEDYNKEQYRLVAIDQAPFFGVRTGAWFLATLDGISINTNMQALDESGNVIEGLYMVGNDSGGFFSVSYPNLFTGLAAGRTMTFGRHAGTYVASLEA